MKKKFLGFLDKRLLGHPSHRKGISYIDEYGINKSKEIIDKKTLSMKGKLSGEKNPSKREDVRKKISFSLIKTYQQNPELKENLKIKHLGKKHNEETKQKMKNVRTGKNYEELFGEEKAKRYKENISKSKIGEKSYNWNNGSSFEPYSINFNKLFKLTIRQRDGFMCLKCGIIEEDAKILFKRILFIHHIDYNKQNTIEENCCSLCLRCNSEVNKDRKSWTKFFQSLLSERYNYCYDENQNIIINLIGDGNEK